MPDLHLNDILDWTGGQLLPNSSVRPDYDFTGISTDTRTLKLGNLYLALSGAQHDGHQFLAQARLAGAAGLLIARADALNNLQSDFNPGIVILVDDTLKALQDIAAGYRLTLAASVIGISGSVGKTSTRQMISCCLETALKVHQTAGNLNNEIGLPQTILAADADHEAVVLEMGMRGPGEISLLSRIAQPDIAVLTCIGLSHIGRLGSQAAILAAKAEIVDGLRPEGLLVLNGDDPLLLEWGRSLTGRRIAWITTEDRLAVELAPDAAFVVLGGHIVTTAASSTFAADIFAGGVLKQTINVVLPFPGTHHIHNAMFGLAIAAELGLDSAIAATGFLNCRITGSRQRIIDTGEILIMDDSYNASPESMLAAMRTMNELAAGRRRLVAALGCMLELGDFADSAHFTLGMQAAELGFARILVTGPQAAAVAAGARSVNPDLPVEVFGDNLQLAAALDGELLAGDCLLVKGSRGFAMEKVTEAVLLKWRMQNAD